MWWTSLSAIAGLNLVLWAWTATVVDADRPRVAAHLALSGVYAAVCAFRSVLPRIDLERTTLVDHPLSSIGLGRSLATVAELCFAAQVALHLHAVAGEAGVGWAQALAWTLVPTLALAQLFCWVGVITLNHLAHAVEESLWLLAMGAVGVALAAVSTHQSGSEATISRAAAALAGGFVLFMAFVDVPMYVRRWRQGRGARAHRLSLGAGWRDAWTRREPTGSWDVWRLEVPWLTGYFSGAVWISLALVHLAG